MNESQLLGMNELNSSFKKMQKFSIQITTIKVMVIKFKFKSSELMQQNV